MTCQTSCNTFFDKLCTVFLRNTESMDKDYIIIYQSGSKWLVNLICPVRTPPRDGYKLLWFLKLSTLVTYRYICSITLPCCPFKKCMWESCAMIFIFGLSANSVATLISAEAPQLRIHKIEKSILNSRGWSPRHENISDCSLSHVRSFLKISWKSVHPFSRNVANRHRFPWKKKKKITNLYHGAIYFYVAPCLYRRG